MLLEQPTSTPQYQSIVMDLENETPPSEEHPSLPSTMPQPPSSQNMFMSPPRRKEKRNPSVTPRRFARFFGPALNHAPSHYGYAASGATGVRFALNDIGNSVSNSQHPSIKRKLFDTDPSSSMPPLLPEPEPLSKRTRTERNSHPFSDENIPALGHRLGPSGALEDLEPPSSPILASSPPLLPDDLDSRRLATLNDFWTCSRSGSQRGGLWKSMRGRFEDDEDADVAEDSEEEPEPVEPVLPIKRFRETSFHTRLFAREIGYSTSMSRRSFQRPAPEINSDVAALCSRTSDMVHCRGFRNGYQLIPFSLATTVYDGKTMAAVGDEEGYVRFITREDEGLGPKYFWQAHANAIMDLDWSPSGTRLATAAGDRSARVLDVLSQSPLANFTGGHDGCLRQVKFQPGDEGGNILATSDRTGRIQVWDARYKRSCCTITEENLVTPDGTVITESTSSIFGDPINTIWSGHSRRQDDVPASITSIQWVSPRRSHLLLSASEADSTIKLWDTRYIGYTRDHKPKPLSVTVQPADHVRRPFGITSMALNTDASRLYAVCKNGTVYTYATSHLVLGHAPELATSGAAAPRPRNGRAAQGLGPLYGFRHERLKVNTFFIKCAVLPQHVTGTEMLAVGSSDSCPIVFPTDERAIRARWELQMDADAVPIIDSSSQQGSGSQPPSSSFSSSDAPPTGGSPTPIVRNGTALVEGTTREVSSVKWTHDGSLVSISDDYSVRFWGRDAEQARFFRRCGDFGGHRHNAGWAEVSRPEFDDEDDPSCV